MAFLFNYSFSGYFQALSLAFFLSVSPVQNIFASVSNCMEMENAMHHEMKQSTRSISKNEADTNQQNDCCNKNKCNSTHCTTTATSAVITPDPIIHFAYTDNNVYQKPNIFLTSICPTSLYRPPRI